MPDYLDIIKTSMDLSKMKEKTEFSVYADGEQLPGLQPARDHLMPAQLCVEEDTLEEEFLVWRHFQHLRRKLLRQHPSHLSRRKVSSLQGKTVIC